MTALSLMSGDSKAADLVTLLLVKPWQPIAIRQLSY